jgi:hypothetical protein
MSLGKGIFDVPTSVYSKWIVQLAEKIKQIL